MGFNRTLRHLFMTHWQVRRHFPAAVLDEIENAVREVEARHSGEIRFVVETALEGQGLWSGMTPRARAREIFGQLGVWDTANNNGVLIYVLFADHAVEILADRGIASCVPADEWSQICRDIEAQYRRQLFAQGSVAGVRAIGRLLERHFPGPRTGANELPNRPVLL
ncbi:MAG: TPM domain-containing protein [Sinobacteraceae bacterium]|nr:TPM domain-containing protein [Nevskiaceae bacterium]